MSFENFIKEAKEYKSAGSAKKLKTKKKEENQVFDELYSIKEHDFSSLDNYKEFYLSLHDFFNKMCDSRNHFIDAHEMYKGLIKSDFMRKVANNLARRGNNTKNDFYLGKILSHSYSFNSVFKKKYRNKIKEINSWFLAKNRTVDTPIDCGKSKFANCNVNLILDETKGF